MSAFALVISAFCFPNFCFSGCQPFSLSAFVFLFLLSAFPISAFQDVSGVQWRFPLCALGNCGISASATGSQPARSDDRR
jgi:hypothetical protein